MVRAAKENGGFIDQKKFKTASKYGFDSLILTDASMQVLDSYIHFVRPLLKPQCEFVLVTRNGGQHSKLGDVMSKLVFDAVGKFIHPTRYRQIVETQSLNLLTSKEEQILSEDQKHSSAVAKVHYQKQRSREVAVKAHECLQKLQGTKGSEVDREVQTRFSGSTSSLAAPVETAKTKSAPPKEKDSPPPHKPIASSKKLSSGVEIHGRRGRFSQEGNRPARVWAVDGNSEGSRAQISRRKNGGLSQEKGWNENAAIA